MFARLKTKEVDDMILADKIIKLRKKSGMSQEELAERINVSRQSVSKWEGAQSIPDLDKIIQISEVFGVTTDYLLKDDINEEEFFGKDVSEVRKISLEEANSYVAHRKRSSIIIAVSVFLCIISPITLIILSELASLGHMSETNAVIIGLITLFGILALAVAGFIYAGSIEEPFSYLSKPFDREYGVEGAIREKKKTMNTHFTRLNIIATVICIAAILPVIICGILGKELLTVVMFGVFLVAIASAVFMYIIAGVRKGAYDKILFEGDYAKREVEVSKLKERIASAYWELVILGYLAWSFISGDWGKTWIIWPIAAVLSGVFSAILGIFNKDYRDSDD